MTYRVFKNSRPAGNLTFSTYEQARQWVRKHLRKSKLRDTSFIGNLCWTTNPMIGDYGYKIRQF